jgi:hypothetical protein
MEEIDHVFRYPVGFIGNVPVVGFVKYYRSMYSLPVDTMLLKGWNVCFHIVEEDDRILILFNRKYQKKDGSILKLFKFNNLWCIKLGGNFWSMLGCDLSKDLHLMKNEDSSISISNKEFPGSRIIQTFGFDDNCLLELSTLLGYSNDVIKDYFTDFKDGICNLIPTIYPGEVRLLIHGNSILLPLDSFYNKIKREVEGEKTFVSIRFNDKDRRIEFIK